MVAVSPAVWTSYKAMMLGPRDAFDDAADFAKYDVIAHADRLAGVDLRIDCGKQDPFYGYVTYLTAALTRPAAGGFSKGGHDHEYATRWRPPRRGSSGGRSATAGPARVARIGSRRQKKLSQRRASSAVETRKAQWSVYGAPARERPPSSSSSPRGPWLLSSRG